MAEKTKKAVDCFEGDKLAKGWRGKEKASVILGNLARPSPFKADAGGATMFRLMEDLVHFG